MDLETEKESSQENKPQAPLSEITAPPPVSREPSRRHPWSGAGDQVRETVTPPSRPLEYAVPSKPAAAAVAAEPRSKLETQLYTVSYLVFFAILGTLARLGLQALTVYPGAPVVTGVLWANVGGCILMGFFSEDKNLFREETIPLYIGLTTGFCGSFTSFSSFIRDAFLALSNDLPVPAPEAGHVSRNGGYSFMAVVATIVTTVSLSLSALIFGAHLALAVDPVTPTFPLTFTRKILDRLAVLLGWGCWLGAVFLAIWPPDRHGVSPTEEAWRGRAVFAIVFAPLGCLLRYYVSLYLNARIPAFPLGTFAVNIFGTIVLGMCFDLQHAANIGALSPLSTSTSTSTHASCQILQGIMDGFCGCTTTVSTWVAELNGLGRRRHAYLYGITSVAVALAFLVVIMGSLRWTVGFVHPAC
ncbi:putative chromosome condensation protein [Thermoascus aurantiacus ATCC 26904]